MEKDKWFGKKKNRVMKETGLQIKLMDMESMFINLVFLLKNNFLIFISENSEIIIEMVLVYIITLMDPYILDIGKMVSKKESHFLLIILVINL